MDPISNSINPQFNPSTRLNGVTSLTSPGSSSNYLDWEFAMEMIFEELSLVYVLTPMAIKDRPLTWSCDNTQACSLITRGVTDVDYQFIKPHQKDAASMWNVLKLAHEDSSAGGRLFVLQTLISTKMQLDDLENHLQTLQKSFEKLSSLVTDSHRLTPDDIYTSALLSLLTEYWRPVISPLMRQATVDSVTVLRAIRSENTC